MDSPSKAAKPARKSRQAKAGKLGGDLKTPPNGYYASA